MWLSPMIPSVLPCSSVMERPVVGQTSLEQELLWHMVMHRQQLHRRDTQIHQMLQRRLMYQTRVCAAQRGWHVGMGGGEPSHVHLIKDRVGQGITGSLHRGHRDVGYHQTTRHKCRGIQSARRRGVIDGFSEHLGSEPHLAVDRARIRVEQQLGRVVPQPACRVERSADPETVLLPRTHPRHEPMPDITVTIRQH